MLSGSYVHNFHTALILSHSPSLHPIFSISSPSFYHTRRTFACPDEQRLGFAAKTKGKLILAPLTKGGTPPFRKLCTDYGAEVTMGEMSFARMLLKGDKIEYTRTRKHEGEVLYGFQFATKQIDEGIGAAKKAAEAGCDFVGLNCGCPIYEASRRGLGAVLLRKPASKLCAMRCIGCFPSSSFRPSLSLATSPQHVDTHNTSHINELQSWLAWSPVSLRAPPSPSPSRSGSALRNRIST